ncbi:hypothetical protein PHYSODRAFT_288982 [Phytophthora sojae]|uniref:RxLR effector protein n=2 Tax=Phytophthora sojae TaxID=67593 RepID=G5ABM4_PHYSP|nr:hypothetical protein PHYSODRAFT_288982 [Phytophthora sojae]AEK81324.1 Avh434 [Phytophthora sojae]AEK81325.1 Avh434 [Phytophthora sojae]AEK81326.1 Avh434 [Phytophthora sojae]EGZ06749.1 hypothetical protein PHYSODRAFT_288982 [Phytophthora sojae]|eukprot:XP_009537513.1 hypothetical protein PHYSODRAFT_288982 [Phytophthora sojae]
MHSFCVVLLAITIFLATCATAIDQSPLVSVASTEFDGGHRVTEAARKTKRSLRRGKASEDSGVDVKELDEDRMFDEEKNLAKDFVLFVNWGKNLRSAAGGNRHYLEYRGYKAYLADIEAKANAAAARKRDAEHVANLK